MNEVMCKIRSKAFYHSTLQVYVCLCVIAVNLLFQPAVNQLQSQP